MLVAVLHTCFSYQRCCSVLDVCVSGFYTFDKIAAVLVGANTILWVVIFPLFLSALNVTREDISDPAFAVSHNGKLFLFLGPHMVLSLFVSLISEQGSMIKAVADIYAGCQPDCVACLKLGVRKALPIPMTSLLATLVAMVLGFLVNFARGLYVMTAWFVVRPFIVLENFGITGSLKRSYSLLSGNLCYVFCTLMTVYFIMIVFQMLWGLLIVLSYFALSIKECSAMC
jgi:hypothetical protein